jgi:putative hydroxymethylpyrimidine transport system substrate-binding protein
MLRKRARLPITVSVLASVSIGAVGPASAQSPSGLPPFEGEPTTIRVVQDWTFVYPPWQIWLYPDAQGWFEEQGLDIEWIIPPTPSDPPRLVASGQADLGFTYTPDVLIANEGELPTLAVSSLIPVPSEHLICRHDKGITEPKDLEGKRIARYDAPLPEAQFQVFAQAQGIDTSTISFVPAGDNGYPVMMADQADCTQAGVFEPSFYRADTGEEPVTFYYTEWGLPDWYWEIVAVNPEWAAANGDALRRFLQVLQKGYEYSRDNVQPALDWLYSAYPETAPAGDIEYNADAMGAMFGRQRDYVEGQPWGHMDPATWQAFADLLVEAGVLTQTVDVGTVLTNEYVGRGSAAGTGEGDSPDEAAPSEDAEDGH